MKWLTGLSLVIATVLQIGIVGQKAHAVSVLAEPISESDQHQNVDLIIKAKRLPALPEWLEQEVLISKENLLKNINPLGTVSGVVVASPQKENPNYFRHWIRDAALVMNVLVEYRKTAKTKAEKKLYDSYLEKYLNFSAQNQSKAFYGEPIFEVNGEPFVGPWGRPQNDGPALRALTLAAWARLLIAEGKESFVRQHLYSSELPASTVIKRDLEFVSYEWRNPCFDLWEEVKAQNFYTLMVQKAALLSGADLAEELNDFGASDWYLRQASQIDQVLKKFSETDKPYLISHINQVEGLSYKQSNLDVSVLLGLLHVGEWRNQKLNNSKVLGTFTALEQQFSNLYSVNRSFNQFAPAIGRYPEDRYAGSNFDGGNPWVLTTAAMAEFIYKSATEMLSGSAPTQSAKKVKLARGMIAAGDEYLRRVQLHANPDGSLSEQIDRFTGYMTSARDLTWSYAGLLTANLAREEALNKIKQSTGTH